MKYCCYKYASYCFVNSKHRIPQLLKSTEFHINPNMPHDVKLSQKSPRKLLCTIIYFILITKQLILCGYCKENLQSDKLAGAERVIASQV